MSLFNKLFIGYIILCLNLVLSNSSYAGNFQPFGVASNKTTYMVKKVCHLNNFDKPGYLGCFDITHKNPEYHETKTSTVDDLTKPIAKSIYKLKSCSKNSASNDDCPKKMAAEGSDYCNNGDRIDIRENKIMPGFKYFCTGISGYEKKSLTVLVENPELKASHKAAKAAEKLERDLVAKGYRDLAFGKRIVVLTTIRNNKKGLTKQQMKKLSKDYAPINALLLSGYISIAKEDITAITPDGTLVTQGDKDAIISEIDKHLGN